ncbi:MAG: class I SAM-dependent methyltransferase [Chloroflexi bacterium]|nr:class I SAM-dependent methyltransferase [Chloroflexota bacterium]
MDDYAAIRRQEGRGSSSPNYYRALPFRDLSRKRAGEWRIRAQGYQALVRHVLSPMEHAGVLRVLDLGAGNGWLAARLAQRGHTVTAIDLQTNDWDGLGAFVHYAERFTPVQAEFDRLPFAAGQFDLAIFNASFHYSEDYLATLSVVLKAVKGSGTVVILDTPVYNDASSGAAMVRERQTQFERAYGTPSNALDSENFLTFARLEELASAVDRAVQLFRPRHSLPWRLKPWLARIKRTREPAQFSVIAFQPRETGG